MKIRVYLEGWRKAVGVQNLCKTQDGLVPVNEEGDQDTVRYYKSRQAMYVHITYEFL